jgi:tRNA pseudouridine38-40 synthase
MGVSTPRTLKLTLAYDGTDFVGWQRQAEGVSIQALLEDALSTIEGQRVTVTGAGRTDAGVHALGQIASVVLAHALDTASLRRALNAMLPPDIRVLAVDEAAEGFHARYGARAKTYRYVVENTEVASPFARRYVWHVPQPLAVEAMAEAARAVEGRHDFSAFQAAGSATATANRTIVASVLRIAGDADLYWGPAGLSADSAAHERRMLVYEVTGDGFLRHMVRAIVGTLVEIGTGRCEAGAMPAIVRSRDRRAAGPTAPACGLCLVRVVFDSVGDDLGLRLGASAL